MTTTALTASTVEPVTPEYAESLGFVPSYTPGAMYIPAGDSYVYLTFQNNAVASAYVKSWLNHSILHLPHLPTRYNLARIVEEFTHKGER